MKAYYKGKKEASFVTPPSRIESKALVVHKENDSFIYTDSGFVFSPRKNGKHYLSVNGEIVRASIVASPEVETWERDPRAINKLFPSAKGAIKLATLITTTLILCMFVVVAWVVTRIFGNL